jgi:RNase P subunit RPR2
MTGHRLQELRAAAGLEDTIVIRCECGWAKRFTLRSAALSAHERHQLLFRAWQRKLVC